MRFLHTADWHLGHKLYQRERDDEFERVLGWLLEYIQQEQIELLIVAGDVFDTDMPPNSARRIYYDFLCKLAETGCGDIVIVGGNHDSPSTLEATKELLRRFRVHVIGQIPAKRSEQVIEIRNAQGELRAVVAAVPYLRDRDLRTSQTGQTSEARRAQIRQAITQHYEELRDEILKYKDLDIPIITTGHLYVAGGERDGRMNTIHIGSLDVLEASAFPPEFDYVALGHLHRPQYMGDFKHIRYSGTLIPLDFNELNYQQVVKVVDFEGKQLKNIHAQKVPQYRKIRHYRYQLAQMKEKLAELDADTPTWLKLEVPSVSYSPNLLDEEIMPILQGKQVQVLTCTQPPLLDDGSNTDLMQVLPNLSDMSEIDVFRMRMDAMGITDPDARSEYESSFQELLDSMIK